MSHSYVKIILLLVCTTFFSVSPIQARPEMDGSQPAEPVESGLKLVRAMMCEGLEEYQPIHPAVVFSISLGEIYCFTAFSPVPEQTVIEYKWYRRDNLVTTRRVVLYPPKWSTYSSIHLRAADIGPWRVEILGPDEKILEVLRFSVTR